MRTPRPPVGTAADALAAQAETLDERAVPVDVLLAQVAEEAAALADQQEQTTTAVVVVLVLLQVLGEVLDALSEHRHLDLGRTGVALVRRVLGHDLALDGSLEGHVVSWFARCAVLRGSSTRALCVRGRSDGIQQTTSRRAADPNRRGQAGSPSSPPTAWVRGTIPWPSSWRHCSTSRAIWSTSACTSSKRRVGRSRPTSSRVTVSPYRSRSVRSSTYASTRRPVPSKVGLVPIDT